jgi:hypothetical protein
MRAGRIASGTAFNPGSSAQGLISRSVSWASREACASCRNFLRWSQIWRANAPAANSIVPRETRRPITNQRIVADQPRIPDSLESIAQAAGQRTGQIAGKGEPSISKQVYDRYAIESLGIAARGFLSKWVQNNLMVRRLGRCRSMIWLKFWVARTGRLTEQLRLAAERGFPNERSGCFSDRVDRHAACACHNRHGK